MPLTTAELHHEQQHIREQLLYLQHSPRNRALILHDWIDRILAPAHGARARSFILEATAQLFEVIPALTAIGCPPSFPAQLHDTVRRAVSAVPDAFDAADVSRADARLVYLQRSVLAWLGEVESGNAVDAVTGREGGTERERLEEYITRLEAQTDTRAEEYRRIADEWDAQVQAAADTVFIPLLEHDLTEGEIRDFHPFGAIGQLHVRMRRATGGEEQDVLRFADAQQATPETFDEVTAALAAMRATLAQFERHTDGGRLIVDIASSNGDLRLVGRSVGLGAAAGMLAAWSEEIHRRNHVQLRAGVLFTGRITRDGNTIALDEEHIARKAELLHYSPYQALVLPKANEAIAQARLDTLQTLHPQRHARLYPARELADVYNNRAVIDIRTRSVAERASRAARRHATVLAIVSTILLLCTVAAWYIFNVDLDTNPYRITLMENEFVIWNKNGKELWRAPAGYPARGYLEQQGSGSQGAIVDTMNGRIMDIDRDGASEVLLGRFGLSRNVHDRMVCYNSNGTIRWKNNLDFGVVTRENDYREVPLDISHLWAGRLVSGAPLRILVDIHTNYYPHALTQLDTGGAILSRYHHLGAIRNYIVRSPRQGRNAKVIVAGQHNGFKGAIIAVLDADSLDGACPQQESHKLLWPKTQSGREDAYILFPKTRLAVVLDDKRMPYALITNCTDTSFTVRINTVMIPADAPSYPNEWAWVEIEFDRSLRPLRLKTSSEYDLFADAVKSRMLWPQGDERDEFFRGIRYWTGREFVDYNTWRKLRPGYRIQ